MIRTVDGKRGAIDNFSQVHTPPDPHFLFCLTRCVDKVKRSFVVDTSRHFFFVFEVVDEKKGTRGGGKWIDILKAAEFQAKMWLELLMLETAHPFFIKKR